MPRRSYFVSILFPCLLAVAGAEELPPPPDVLRLPPVGAPEAEGGPALEPASAPDPDPPAEDEVPAEPDDAVPADAPPQYVPVFLFPAYQELVAWSGSVELGLDGTTGNSETFNFRFGCDLERTWDIHQFDVDLDYLRKTAGRIETANRALLDWRYERLFRNTRWTWFVHGTVEYDEFEAWDCRVTADTGLGYQIIATDSTKFISRTGAGFARTFGLPDDRWVPEMVMGLDFEHKVGKRHRLKAKVDYMPDLTNFAGYRINSQGSWEMLIDEAMNLSLKLSARSRYDSTPRAAKPHDLDYSAVVMWRF